MLPETKLWQQFYAVIERGKEGAPDTVILVRERFLGLVTQESDVLFMGLVQAVDTVHALRAGLLKWSDIKPKRAARPLQGEK